MTETHDSYADLIRPPTKVCKDSAAFRQHYEIIMPPELEAGCNRMLADLDATQ